MTSRCFERALRNNWSILKVYFLLYIFLSSRIILDIIKIQIIRKWRVATTVASQNLLLAFCALWSFPFFTRVVTDWCAPQKKSLSKTKALGPSRYTFEQPRDNVRVLQDGRRGHNRGEQTGPESEPDPDSGPGPSPSPDSEYGQPSWNCRGSSSRGPR